MKNSLVRLLFILLIILSPINFGNANQETTQIKLNEFTFQNINLSTNKTVYPHHVEPTLTIDGNVTYVGFKNAPTHDGGGEAVSFTYTSDGLSWSSPYNMKQFYDLSGQSDPWMHVFDEILYYVYLEYPLSEVGQSQMTLAKTSDQGINWNLTRATFGDGFADKETFTIDENGYIYLAYDDVYDTHTEMKLSRSFDGGVTFVENVTMSDAILDGYLAPYIVSGGSGVLYNVFSYFSNSFTKSDIFFDKSFDYGETWGVDTDLNPSYNASAFTAGISGRPSKSTLPAMTVDQNGRIYVVWEDVSANIGWLDWDVYMKFSDNNGTSWSENIRINKNVEGESWMPDVDVDSLGNLYVAYYDNNILGQSNLMYRIYYPSNNSLSDEFRISTEGTPSEFTRLGDYVTIRLDDNDKFHVVWTDGRNGVMDIYYASNKLNLVDIDFDGVYHSNHPTTTSSSTTSSSTSKITSSKSTSSSKKSESRVTLAPFVLIIIPVIIIRKLKR